jgi:hypothetical protein
MREFRPMQFVLDSPFMFADEIVPEGTRLVGYAALVRALKIQAPVRSLACVSVDHVKGSTRKNGAWRIYDKRYWPGDTFGDHLSFALKHEPVDLLILKRATGVISEKEMIEFVSAAPTGAANRRAWFFYEILTGEKLNIPDAGQIPAIDALDPKSYFTAPSVLSKRHRVKDNLLGNGLYCPIIRRTKALETYLSLELAKKAGDTVGRTGRHLVARAASFMLLADSRASFEIEGERPARNRLERWGKAVLQAGKNKLQTEELIRLQGVVIEDSRLTHIGLRLEGVFLGEHDHEQVPLPEFIGACPDDLANLMEGLIQANSRMREGALDAVLQATATAFGFVYIHPFEDGNGRVHRCLIHHVLAERKFTPPGMVFPVSSVMLDRIDDYQKTLEGHSGPLMEFIEWRATAKGNVDVTNDTADLYRFFDCTEEAEFLYSCVQHTVEEDLPREIDYLSRHDEALHRIMNAVEMPDRIARDFVVFVLQNKGVLPKRRRNKEFESLTDGEISELEEIVQDVFEDAE